MVFGSEIWSSPEDRRVVGRFAPSRPAISPAAVRHLAVLLPTNSGPMVCVAPFRSVSPPGPLRTGSRGMDLYTRIGFCRRVLGGAGSPSVVAPRCAATFVRSRLKWTRAFLVPRPRLASLSSIRPIFMTAPCTVKMLTPFGAVCPPVVHARKVRSCSPHRQGMAFLCGFFRSLGGGDAAIDAGRLLSAQRFFPTVGITVSPAPAHLLTVHAHWEECGPSLFVRQVFRAPTALQPCVVPPCSARPLSVTAPHDSKICPRPSVLHTWLSRPPPSPSSPSLSSLSCAVVAV